MRILLVTHDEGGDWQFLNGGVLDATDAFAVHICHVFDDHPEVRALADLPERWAAERLGRGGMGRFPQPDDWE